MLPPFDIPEQANFHSCEYLADANHLESINQSINESQTGVAIHTGK